MKVFYVITFFIFIQLFFNNCKTKDKGVIGKNVDSTYYEDSLFISKEMIKKSYNSRCIQFLSIDSLKSRGIRNKPFLNEVILNDEIRITHIPYLNSCLRKNFFLLQDLKSRKRFLLNMDDHEVLFNDKASKKDKEVLNNPYLFGYQKKVLISKQTFENGIYADSLGKIEKLIPILDDIKEVEVVLNEVFPQINISASKERRELLKKILIITQIKTWLYQLKLGENIYDLEHFYNTVQIENDYDLNSLYEYTNPDKNFKACFYQALGYNNNLKFIKGKLEQIKSDIQNENIFYFYTFPDFRLYKFIVDYKNGKIHLQKELINWPFFNPMLIYCDCNISRIKL